MAITYRNGLGRPLTEAELDQNFREGDEHPNGIKTRSTIPLPGDGGIVFNPDNPTSGYHDLRATLQRDTDEAVYPPLVAFRGGVKSLQFDVDVHSAYANFHIPHDYMPGSDLFIHVHWLHNSTTVTGGSVTWGFEATYSKGHQQEAFSAPIIVPVTQNASTTQYFHMIAETALSVSGGSGNQLNTDLIEVDGVVCTRLYLDSNDITVSAGQVPKPFAIFVDLHYQSTGIPTLNKEPSFYGV